MIDLAIRINHLIDAPDTQTLKVIYSSTNFP